MVEEGLPGALQQLARDMKTSDALQVSLEIHGEETFSERIATGLYFIAHEALINVAKHSGVREATLRLNLVEGHSCLEIEDQGQGFDTDAAFDQRGHLGLISMVERAREIGWRVSVWSRPDQGTRICVAEHPSEGPG